MKEILEGVETWLEKINRYLLNHFSLQILVEGIFLFFLVLKDG